MSSVQHLRNTTTVSGKQMTPFGAVKDPLLLERLPQTNVLRVDTLHALKDLWGMGIVSSREHLYRLVSGEISDSDFQELISSYYKRYAAFANYIDAAYLFGNRSESFVTRIILPVRKHLAAHVACVTKQCHRHSGTLLGMHEDYLYFSFPEHAKLPTLEGGERIC